MIAMKPSAAAGVVLQLACRLISIGFGDCRRQDWWFGGEGRF
jgi:hypothetical protein